MTCIRRRRFFHNSDNGVTANLCGNSGINNIDASTTNTSAATEGTSQTGTSTTDSSGTDSDSETSNSDATIEPTDATETTETTATDPTTETTDPTTETTESTDPTTETTDPTTETTETTDPTTETTDPSTETDTGVGACPAVEGFNCDGPVDCQLNLCGGVGDVFDEGGCLRMSCQTDDDCAADERCYHGEQFGDCLPSVVFCDTEDGLCLCGSTDDCGGAFCVPEELYPG